ncbi:hypothetical protein ES707_19617 [subsurface metagenome]
MANIVFFDDVDEITGSIKGLTFDKSQAGNYVKKRPIPVDHHTNPRMHLRALLKSTNEFFTNLTDQQKNTWAIWTANNVSLPPFGMDFRIAGCYGFFSIVLNAQLAGDPIYANHPPHNPTTPPTWLTLTRIDNNTIRVTFNPSAEWVHKRIYLRQALPGPGVRRWSAADGYIAEYSPLNPNSPHDFTTHFPHLAGWHGRYWTGTQRPCGCRSAETLWDL